MQKFPFRLLALVVFCFGMVRWGQAQIYVANDHGGGPNDNTIGEYATATGAPIAVPLVNGISDGLENPQQFALSNGNLYVPNYGFNSISVYNASTGALVDPHLITGLGTPRGVVVYGGNLYVVNQAGTIGEYSLSGTVINSALVTGLNVPLGLAEFGGNLYVTQAGSNSIGVYNAVTGATVNNSFITGLNGPWALTVSGGELFVANTAGSNATQATGTIGAYDAITGTPINTALVTGLRGPLGVSVASSTLFVTNYYSGAIGAYDALTGATINAAFISGLSSPVGILAMGSIQAVPEPGTWLAGGLAAVVCIGWMRRRKVDCS